MTIQVKGETLEVIDVHTQMGHIADFKDLNVLERPKHLGSDAIELMDTAGIDKIIAFPEFLPATDYSEANRIVANEMKKYPDRIIGFGRLNPFLGPGVNEKLLDVMFRDLGLKGLKLHPVFDYYVANDEVQMYPIMEKLRKYKAPALIHSGENWTSSPALIGDLASHFPDVTVIIAHMSYWGYPEDALVVAKNNDNILMDTSVCGFAWHITKAARVLGADRILFGSDSPYQFPGLELDKLVKYSRLTTDDLRKILAENIKDVLRIK